MEFKIKEFNNFNKSSWDDLLNQLEGPLQNCSWNNLSYYSAYKGISNISFAVFSENRIIALIPMARNLSKEQISFSFGNNLIFCPIFSPKIKSSNRKKIYKFLFDYIKTKYKIRKKEINFQVSPVFFEKDKLNISSKNQFELLEHSKSYIVHNTLIINLSEKEDQLLLNMSKYHRKNINKTSKIKKLSFKVLNFKNKKIEIEKRFKEFKNFHLISAGRITRPPKTWKIMLKKIYDGEANLFFLTLNNKNISYLYCSTFRNFAWGWSQVNKKKYENISPRHFLEWNAIKYYKRRKFDFYEIGERFFKQNKFNPTKKEITISEFKEKYGSDKYPKVNFRVEI